MNKSGFVLAESIWDNTFEFVQIFEKLILKKSLEGGYHIQLEELSINTDLVVVYIVNACYF